MSKEITKTDLALKFLELLASLSLLAFIICGASGCKNQNTGSAIKVGDITSLPEISDASDNITIKVLLMMTGASIWTAKDSLVKVVYENSYTNNYCGIIERVGRQNLTVRVEPLDTGDVATNAAPLCVDSNGGK